MRGLVAFPLRNKVATMAKMTKTQLIDAIAEATQVSKGEVKAVIEAMMGHVTPFARTPKYGVARTDDDWQHKKYHQSMMIQPFIELTLGVQLGGTTFHELVVFHDDGALERFKQGKFAFAADAGVAIVKAGAQATKGFGESSSHCGHQVTWRHGSATIRT